VKTREAVVEKRKSEWTLESKNLLTCEKELSLRSSKKEGNDERVFLVAGEKALRNYYHCNKW
jgi:hypothetical protein